MKLISNAFSLAGALLAIASSTHAIDGTFAVTESWFVRIKYYEFGQGEVSGQRSFSGRQTGTLIIRDGQYRLINRTGLQIGGDGDLLERTITTDPDFGDFYIEGREPFAAVPGRAYGILFLGCFAVKVPLLAGEVPPLEDGFFYSAYGDDSSEIRGAGEMTDGGETMTVVAGSTLSLRPISTPSTTAPRITIQPKDTTVDYGRKAVLFVRANGTPPLSFQWWKGATQLAGETAATLTLDQATSGDAGNYSVTIVNSFGAVVSDAATLVVRPPIPPAINLQPRDKMVRLGRPLRLAARSKGSAPLAYQWFCNGGMVPGANTNVFSVPAVQSSNGGNYFLVVSNAAGSVTSRTALVTIKPATP